jgi:hypothetical protein
VRLKSTCHWLSVVFMQLVNDCGLGTWREDEG